jgi:hypothetical protein
VRDDPPIRGRKHYYVLLVSTRPGWKIYQGSEGFGPDCRSWIYGFNMIRTDEGIWFINIRPEEHQDVIDISVDDPGAIAFLETFAD